MPSFKVSKYSLTAKEVGDFKLKTLFVLSYSTVFDSLQTHGP